MLFYLLLCLQIVPAPARYYSWTDDNGVQHFADAPPPSVEATGAPVPTADSQGLKLDPAAASWKPPSDTQARERPDPTRLAAERARQQHERAEKCHRYQQKMDQVQAERRAGYSPARGATLARTKRALREEIRRYCD